MISLSFKQPHRSILSFPATTLPDLSIITGVNGSGKSHLLEAIKNGSIAVEGIRADDADIRLFNWTNMAPASSGSVDPVQLTKQRNQFLDDAAVKFKDVRESFAKNIANFNIPSLPLDNITALLTLKPADLKKFETGANSLANFSHRYQQLRQHVEEMTRNALGKQNPSITTLLTERATALGIPLCLLSFREMDDAVPLNWTPTDIFAQNFSQIFATYHRAWDENRYNEFANKTHGETNPILTDDEFRARFGEPPWDFVNRVLGEAHLEFEINRPTGRAERPFEVKLTDRATGVEISFKDLSSGEKIIMSFLLCLYHVSDRVGRVTYPKLLLFDEVDAPLHPSMTQDLLRVIERVLIKEKGLRVILTTHSPASVAFSPEGALFRLEKYPRSLVASSREQAVQILTSGYITVTENTRFVITEAKKDRHVYTRIVRKLVERQRLKVTPNLVFLQASDKKDRVGGGRAQVRDWGEKLPSAGLTQILGLIDRDTNNTGSATIKVLSRHSLENYLCDPLIIYAVLMNHGHHLHVHDAGIKDKNFYDLCTVDETILQSIVDHTAAAIEKHSPQVQSVAGTFRVEYLSGKAVTLPRWVRDFNGHDLEAAVREAFRSIVNNGFIITHSECADLLDMMERMPDFIPIDLVRIFESLQV